jgi:hypothetical protein
LTACQIGRGGSIGLGGDGNPVKDGWEIGKDVGVPEVEDVKAPGGKPMVPGQVTGAAMVTFPGFDNQATFSTIEVGDEGADRNLTPDLEPEEPAVP